MALGCCVVQLLTVQHLSPAWTAACLSGSKAADAAGRGVAGRRHSAGGWGRAMQAEVGRGPAGWLAGPRTALARGQLWCAQQSQQGGGNSSEQLRGSTHSRASRYCWAWGARSSHLVLWVTGRPSLVTKVAAATDCCCCCCWPNSEGAGAAPKSEGALLPAKPKVESAPVLAAPRAGVPAAPKKLGVEAAAGKANAGVLTAPPNGEGAAPNAGVLAAPKSDTDETGAAEAAPPKLNPPPGAGGAPNAGVPAVPKAGVLVAPNREAEDAAPNSDAEDAAPNAGAGACSHKQEAGAGGRGMAWERRGAAVAATRRRRGWAAEAGAAIVAHDSLRLPIE